MERSADFAGNSVQYYQRVEQTLGADGPGRISACSWRRVWGIAEAVKAPMRSMRSLPSSSGSSRRRRPIKSSRRIRQTETSIARARCVRIHRLQSTPAPAARMMPQTSPASCRSQDDFENLQDHHRSRRVDVFHPAHVRSEDRFRESASAGEGHGERVHVSKHDRDDGRSAGGAAAKKQSRSSGARGIETLNVRLDLDDEVRDVEPPADFVKALKASPPAWARYQELSYSHRREHVEAILGAKKPETRVRRIESAVRMIGARPARAPRSVSR